MTTHLPPASDVQTDAATKLPLQAEPTGCYPCDEALISRQRQRYLASVLREQAPQDDIQYREQ